MIHLLHNQQSINIYNTPILVCLMFLHQNIMKFEWDIEEGSLRYKVKNQI